MVIHDNSTYLLMITIWYPSGIIYLLSINIWYLPLIDTIKQVRLLTKKTGESKGCAFLEFNNKFSYWVSARLFPLLDYCFAPTRLSVLMRERKPELWKKPSTLLSQDRIIVISIYQISG